ncbi:MAG TPA: hypothetical protein VKA55_06525 [Gammaproteobacteria bacterium]|nr:hypothetical protein [Gammaproteobacteria bacterium]
MNLRRVLAAFAVLTVVLTLAACRTAPIQNVNDAPIPANAGSPSLEEITKAIQRAGIGLGWQMDAEKPGHIIGTLYIRSHMAKVDINYSTKGYSITYRDSKNLKHHDDKIHSNYNGWVQNLDRAIQQQLLSL